MKRQLRWLMRKLKKRRKATVPTAGVMQCALGHSLFIGPDQSHEWALINLFRPLRGTRVMALTLSAEQLAKLESLREACGLACICEVFNNALTLMGWGIEEAKSGKAICSIDYPKKIYRELIMTPLAAARAKFG